VRDRGLLAPAAIVVALVAARMTESHRIAGGDPVAAATCSFFLGMLSIWTDSLIF
jgi:hypothetical protein